MKNFLAFFLSLWLALAWSILPAAAELTTTQLTGFNVGGAAPASLSFVSCTTDTSNLSTYTFTSHATGTAGNRWTIVSFHGRRSSANWSYSSATVGGNSATEVIDTANASSVVQSAIYIIANPSGTTATIVVNTSVAVASMTVCVWAGYDLQSATAVDTASAFSSTSAAMTLDLDISSGGFAVGAATSQTGTPTHTWTGMTERSDAASGDIEHTYSAADTNTAGAPRSVSADGSGVNNSVGVSASFR